MFNNIRFVVLGVSMAMAGSLAACGSDSGPAGAETRTVTDALGTETIPSDPRKIVALDEHSAMTMLTAGVAPDLVYGTLGSPTSTAVLEQEGVSVEPYPNFLYEPDFEQVASEQPDLIVISGAGPLPRSIEMFREIAPTVVLSYTDGWRASLLESGAIFDTADTAARAAQAIEERIGDLDSRLPADATLSILFGYDNSLHYPAPTAPMSQLVAEVGLTRPDAELVAEGEIAAELIVPFSSERLAAHDADRMAVLSGTSYNASFVRSQPLFAGLSVAADGRAPDVDGETWWGNSVFTSWWILNDLEAMFLGEGSVGVIDDATDRWDQLEKAMA